MAQPPREPGHHGRAPGRTLAVHGRAATAEERPRLWELWRRYEGDELDAWAARRPRETAIVILEPR